MSTLTAFTAFGFSLFIYHQAQQALKPAARPIVSLDDQTTDIVSVQDISKQDISS
jgi:hypothetical protein